MHWNILADKLSQNFDRVPNKLLDWKYRWPLIQQEVKQVDPDFVGLSEVDKYDQIREWMESQGYRGYLGMKKNGISGSAIFWKQDRFLCEYRKMTQFDKDSSHIFVYGKFSSLANKG